MARVVRLVLLASSLISGCGLFSSEYYGDELLIRHVQIVSPGNYAMEAPTDVLIRNRRIHVIGESVADQAGKEVESLDGTGLFLSPGLIDGHTHLNEIPGMTFDHERAYPEVAAEARRQIPLSYLYHGFTTIVDLNAAPVTIDRWNSKATRPQAYFCGAAPVFDNVTDSPRWWDMRQDALREGVWRAWRPPGADSGADSRSGNRSSQRRHARSHAR